MTTGQGRRVDWPRDLLAELEGKRGTFALMAETPDARAAFGQMERRIPDGVARVGALLTAGRAAPEPQSIPSVLGSAPVLVDCEILFAQDLKLNPLQVFRALARQAPRIILWPGTIEGRRAGFSRPGRSDFFEAELKDTVVLRPVTTHFPDEVPYEVERIA